jgi:iron complex outermembrane recepter protein
MRRRSRPTTLDPSVSGTEAKFKLSYARFGEVRANGYVNLPISDKVEVNAAVSYKYSPGYIRDLRTGRLINESRTFAARGKLLLKPADTLEVILTAGRTVFDDPTRQAIKT